MTSADPLRAAGVPPLAAAGSAALLDLLARLGVLDVRLSADGDALHYDAPGDAVTDDLLALLRTHKPELLRFLAAHAGEPQPESSGPVTFGQRRMHDQCLVSPKPATFNVAQRIELTGRLDVAALSRALTALLRRQSALRTRFTRYGSELVQEVMPLPAVRLDVTDLRQLTAHERERSTGQWLRRHADTPFDLAVAPLLRADLLRTDEASWTLALVVHHAVVDGWGLGVLLSDLGALYAAALRVPGARPPTDDEAALPPLAVSFADAARLQRALLSGPRLDRLRSYWRQALTGAPMIPVLPYDHPRPEQRSGRGGQVSVRLARELTDGIAAVARARGTTVFTVLLSAYGTLLCRLSGQREVVVACNIANRTRQEHEPLVGMFTNNVALRLGTADDDGFTGALAATAQTFFAAADHQEYPLAMLLADGVGHFPPNAPTFPRAIIVMESQGVPVLDLPGLTAQVHDLLLGGSKSDLCLVLTPDDDGIEMVLVYAMDLFEAATGERFADEYTTLLREYVRHALR